MEAELKYIVPNQNIHPLLEFVRTLCIPDSKYCDAMVSSIYFDSDDFHNLHEKINSDYYKTKYRVRWYQDYKSQELSDRAYMEAKMREGSTRSKRRVMCRLNPTELEEIDLEDRALQCIPLQFSEAGVIPENNLFPVLQIKYSRRRFLEPLSGYRVSIDTDIGVTKINQRLLPDGRPATLQNAVIEIKGEVTRLPDSFIPMIKMGMRKASFSKYLACYARAINMLYDPR